MRSSILELPEIVTHILLNLQTRERAQSRLINHTFNQVYLIEEQDEFLHLWNKYRNGLAFGYNEPLITDHELSLFLQEKSLGISTLQYHLKLFLTMCSNGRFEQEQSLLCISHIGDWELIDNMVIPFNIYTAWKEYFGEETMKNLICVHYSFKGYHLMDRRNGQFYETIGLYNNFVWKELGIIKEWLENIPYDILYPLSRPNSNGGIKYDLIDEFKNISKRGDRQILTEFIRKNIQYYPFLRDEMKRNEEILQILSNSANDNPGLLIELSTSIPYDIRRDRELFLKYKICVFPYFFPSELKNDKEFIIKILETYGTAPLSLQHIKKEFLTDVRVLKLVKDLIVEYAQNDTIVPGLELDSIEKIVIFGEHPSVYPYISKNILNDHQAILEILKQIYSIDYSIMIKHIEFTIQHFVDINPLFLGLIDTSLRNSKEFMIQFSQRQSLLFLGKDLQRDFQLISRATPTALRSFNLTLTMDEYLDLFQKIESQSDIVGPFTSMHFFKVIAALEDLIPREYLRDEEFCLELCRLTFYSSSLMNHRAMKNIDFWKRAIQQDDSFVTAFAPIEIKNDRDLILGMQFTRIHYCSEELLNDADFLIEFFSKKIFPEEYVYLSREMRSNKKLFMSLVDTEPRLIEFVSGDLLNDPDIVNLKNTRPKQ